MKTIDKRTVLERGKFLTVEDHTVELPDGDVIEQWAWVITPGYINVVVVDTEGLFCCFRQPKYGYDGESLAPVGGYIEPDEDPLHAAQRELREEMGYEAPTWIALGQTVVDANRGCGRANAFLALDAQKVTEPDSDDLEPQTLVRLSRDDIEAALFNGEMKVLAWTNVIALALLYLDRRQKA